MLSSWEVHISILCNSTFHLFLYLILILPSICCGGCDFEEYYSRLQICPVISTPAGRVQNQLSQNTCSNSIFCGIVSYSQLHQDSKRSSRSVNLNSNNLAAKMAPTTDNQSLSLHDPNSFSNPEAIRADHLSLIWNVDFARKLISGKVSYDLVVNDSAAKNIVFDTNGLNIKKVSSIDGKPLDFELGSPVLSFGSPLTVNLESLLQSNQSRIQIQIEYETGDNCTALQWLDEEQTAGKKHPYMFSQCEAIHARSLLPCQDTPFTKASYKAQVTVPKDLQALMSAVILDESVEKGNSKSYFFDQKIPIPSYLIAIAAGNIKGKKIGPRSTVWSEPELLEASAYEFVETEEMLKAGESIMGEYVWGTYDLLVLPPSFPYGGMENPCLTFVTPTLLAGDRSLVNVIAHEITHSWTGNLVTNKNWEHFWLNEGFTVFGERKILGLMHGEPARQFASIGGWHTLEDCVQTLKADNPMTKLVKSLVGIDPDDAFSSIPYEKGYAFLYYLEQKVGGPSTFEPFFKDYIQSYRFQSIDTDVFKLHFNTYFGNIGLSDAIKDVDWDAWLFTTGMPLVKPTYDTSLVDACKQLKTRWVQWKTTDDCPFNSTDFNAFSAAQKEQFLTELLDTDTPLKVEKLKIMQKVYNLNAMKNAEIRFRWIRLGIKSKWEAQVPLALQFVAEQGRMKYVRPIYRELYNWEQVRDQTIEHFKKTRTGMMLTCANLVAKDLHLN